MFESLKNLKNMGGMLKNAQGMQEEMQTMQAELEDQPFGRQFLNGKIEIVMTGGLQVVQTVIDPEYVASVSNEQLQTDISESFSDLIAAINQHKAEKMQEITMSMFGDMDGVDMEEIQKMMK